MNTWAPGTIRLAHENRADFQEGGLEGAKVALDLLQFAVASVHRRGRHHVFGDIRLQQVAAIQQGICHLGFVIDRADDRSLRPREGDKRARAGGA